MTEIGNSKLIVGISTPENPLAEIWKNLKTVTSTHFHILKALKGTVLALGGIFYLIFADGEVQDWAKNDEENEEDDMIIKS